MFRQVLDFREVLKLYLQEGAKKDTTEEDREVMNQDTEDPTLNLQIIKISLKYNAPYNCTDLLLILYHITVK